MVTCDLRESQHRNGTRLVSHGYFDKMHGYFDVSSAVSTSLECILIVGNDKMDELTVFNGRSGPATNRSDAQEVILDLGTSLECLSKR